MTNALTDAPEIAKPGTRTGTAPGERSLLIVDNVIDVGDAAMRWAGMPNKHERSLTSEVFFALAEWGFLAPRADGRYRVLHAADDDPVV